MSRPDRPGLEKRDYWFRPSTVTQYVRLTCPPRSFVGHWDSRVRRSRRCGGDLCALCQLGWEPVRYSYVGVMCDDGNLRIVELRSRHAALLERLEDIGWDCVGLELAIVKEGSASNSPVTMILGPKSPTTAQDIEAFVKCIGLPHVLMAGVEVVDSESSARAM